MLTTSNQKLCLACEKPLKGRVDKKFCDDYCRSSYNNQLNADGSVQVKKINAILKKNRRILDALMAGKEEAMKCNRKKLTDKGFNFNFFTNIYVNKKSDNYYFVYEFGYLPLDNDWFLLVKRNEEV
jgi:hypothetical protein